MNKYLCVIICLSSVLTACDQHSSKTEHYAVQQKKQMEADLKQSMETMTEKRESMDEL